MTETVRPAVKLGGSFSLTDHHGNAVTAGRSWEGIC